MEHSPPEDLRCDRCSTDFNEVDELAKHKQSHDRGKMEDQAIRPDGLHVGGQIPRTGLKDLLGPMPTVRLDDSDEDARSERDLVEGERNDLANAQANRDAVHGYRDDNEWEVNPDQTPKEAKAIRPIDSD